MAFQEDLKASFDRIEIREEAVDRIRERAAAATTGVANSKFIRVAAACMSLVVVGAAIAVIGNGSSKSPVAAVASSSASSQAVQSAPLTLSEQLAKIPTEGRIKPQAQDPLSAATATAATTDYCLEPSDILFYNGVTYRNRVENYYLHMDTYGMVELINHFKGEKLGQVTNTLNPRYTYGQLTMHDNGDDTSNPHWEESGTSTYPVGSAFYAVNGYDPTQVVLFITESDKGFPGALFLYSKNSASITNSEFSAFQLTLKDYIDNITKSQFVLSPDSSSYHSDSIKELDSTPLNTLLKNISAKSSTKTAQESFVELFEKTKTIRNVIDGTRCIQLITKDNIVLDLQITNNGYVYIFKSQMLYKADESAWRPVWESLTLEETRTYMDKIGYYYHDGIGGYAPKSAPYYATKFVEEMERIKHESSEG